MKYSEALNKEEWSNHYNIGLLDYVVETIKTGNVSIWAEELLEITNEGDKCLEIGCGTGISSLWLASHKREVTALDYSETAIELVERAAEELRIVVKTSVYDATKELPYDKKSFDYIFQCGLLEHFSITEQIELLRKWGGVCRKMISMIPNAHSLPYRVGKKIMEDSGTWKYGLEIPKHSMIQEFSEAGIKVEREYTIGTEWALKFLPKRHYLRKSFERLKKDGHDLENMGQGYLIVTIGDCSDVIIE